MHNLLGWVRFPAPQLRLLNKKNSPKGEFFLFQPHEDGVNEVHIMSSSDYNGPMYYVYILESQKKLNWLYKGSTSDLKRRIAEHNAGKSFATAPYAPFKLIYYEAYVLKADAEARERYLKTSMGMRVIKKQLANYLHFKKKAPQ